MPISTYWNSFSEVHMKNIENSSTRDSRNLLLHVAILNDSFDVVEYLISEESIDINTKDNQGKTPLHLAAARGNLYMIKCLLEKGANINDQDKCGCTPLHYAANIKTIKFLIDKGADYNITDGNSNTRMFYAFEYANLELIKYFVEEKLIDPMTKINEYGCTLFGEAFVSGDLDTIMYLIDEKSVVYNGNDLVESAISHGHFATVKYLIEEKKVDVNYASKSGWTHLFDAVERGDVEIIEYLLERGVDVDAKAGDRTSYGFTTLLLGNS